VLQDRPDQRDRLQLSDQGRKVVAVRRYAATSRTTRNFATGLSVVNSIGAAAEEMNHHPDLNLRYTYLDARLTSHHEHGVTDRDIRLARTISSTPPTQPCSWNQRTSRGLSSPSTPRPRESVLPFWAAVLAMEHLSGLDCGDELRDPSDGLPAVWFQASGSEEPRQRWPPDVWVDPAQVKSRIDAALTAGGTLVSDVCSAPCSGSRWVWGSTCCSPRPGRIRRRPAPRPVALVAVVAVVAVVVCGASATVPALLVQRIQTGEALAAE
jgi:4a-hydroxytetrahydrobiopterin dehydratase